MKLKFDLIKFLLTVFVIVFVFVALFQVYNYLYKDAATEFAVEITCEDTIKATGYFIRNESVITSNNSKFIDLIINDGGKIARNGTIANVYSTENAAKIQTQIRDVESQIEEFESVISTASKYHEENSYSDDIKKSMLKMQSNISSSDFDGAFKFASEFTTNVIKDKIACGEIIDYSDNLKVLKEERDKLKNESSSVTNYITSPVSGYFSYKADGCESKLSMDMIEEFDASVFNNIVEICSSTHSEGNGAIGKVVSGSDWIVCFTVPAADVEKTKVGNVMNIRIPSVTNSVIKCVVKELFFEGDNAYLVLESNMVSGELLSQRVCEIDIIVDSYEGLRVDKNSLRKIDGVNGVFVKSNGILRYREVEILYLGSTFAVVKYDPLDKSHLQVYDEVVIKGSDLYDGKVVS